MIKKIAVLTSGGDAPGMNAAIRAVTRTAIRAGLEVYGIHDGYLGMFENNIEKLNRKSVSEKMGIGGTFLGTARLKSFTDDSVREVALENLKNLSIDALVAIGGDGTYRGGLALSKMGLPVVCLPGTIDNDIALTDFTIGFDTALNTIVDAVDKLRDTSNSHRRCSIIEVMGRYCGDMAIWAAIASGAEVCIFDKEHFDLKEVIDNVTAAAKAKRHAIIVLTENIIDINILAKEVTRSTPFEARATVLGHVQRGGKPTVRDRVLASEMGVKAVEALLEGLTHHCIAINGSVVKAIPLEDVIDTIDRNQTLEKYEVFKKLW